MKVSVVIPSLDQAAFLEQAILSVLDQRGIDFEVIVIDGGSSDGSQEIIERHAHRLAYWVSEPDSGQSEAINKGWAQASGDVLCWLNADDYYLPGALATAGGYLSSAPEVGVVYGDCFVVDRDGAVTGRQAPRPFDLVDFVMRCNDYIPSGSTFLRASVAATVGTLGEDLHYLMDQDYWLRCGLVTTIRAIPDTLSCFRVYPEAKTWSGGGARAAELARVFEAFAARDDLPAALARQRGRIRAHAHAGAVGHYLHAGDVSAGWREVVLSVRNAPLCCLRTWLRIARNALRRVTVGTAAGRSRS